MSATSIDLSQIKTDALSAASTFRTLIGLGTSDTPTFKAATLSAGTLNGTVLDISQTWGGTGTYTGLRYNVTDSGPANAASLLMDLQVGGSSKFKVDKAGTVFTNRIQFGSNLNDAVIKLENAVMRFGYFSNGENRFYLSGGAMAFASNYEVSWTNGNATIGTTDVRLFRDAANTLALRNDASAQALRIYNTYTDASNYERAKIAWSSNVLQIGTEKLGTGAARALELQTDGTTRLTIGNGSTAPSIRVGNGTGSLHYNGSNDASVLIHGTQGDRGQFEILSPNQAIRIVMQAVQGYGAYLQASGGDLIFDCNFGSNNYKIAATAGNGKGIIFANATDAAADVLIHRPTSGQLDIRGNSGLRVRNFANSADADITAAKATLSATLDLTIRTVTYGATMAIDAALGNKIAITLAGNGTISNPTNAVDGRVLVFRLRQDGTGSRVPVWDTKYSFVGDLATVTLSTAANKIDRIAFEYDSTDDKWYCISFIKGS